MPATDRALPTLWVALLRGINVGGNRRMAMADLRACLAAAGGEDVRTHIQSGNVLLRHPTVAPADLTATLEEAIEARFGFSVSVVLRAAEDVAGLLARCPFTGRDWDEDRRRYVSFLAAPAEAGRAQALLARAAPGEALYVTGTEVCAAVTKDAAKPAYADIERILNVRSTARAWNVVETLGDLAAR